VIGLPEPILAIIAAAALAAAALAGRLAVIAWKGSR